MVRLVLDDQARNHPPRPDPHQVDRIDDLRRGGDGRGQGGAAAAGGRRATGPPRTCTSPACPPFPASTETRARPGRPVKPGSMGGSSTDRLRSIVRLVPRPQPEVLDTPHRPPTLAAFHFAHGN